MINQMPNESAIKRCGTQTDMTDPSPVLKLEFTMSPEGYVMFSIESHPELDDEDIIDLIETAVERLESQ